MTNMKIKKQLLTTILLSTMAFGISPVQAFMSPEASMLYQQACTAEHEQDLKEAISKLEQAIAISGGDAMLYTKLAGIYSEIDEYDKALDAYNKVINLKPDDAFVHISIGSIYENQGKYKEALASYNKALDIFPEYKYNYFNIGNAQYQLRQYNEAIKSYNAFLETYAQHSEARENLAASYLAVKDYKNASKQYKRIYDRNPEGFKNYSEYGITLLNSDNPESAAEMLEKAIEIDADNNAAHLALAQAYQDMGKNDLSYEQYQVVLKKVPNLNTVRLDYADLLANMEKNTEAIEQYNMYIKAFPNDIKGYSHLAAVYQTIGNYSKAIENYLVAEAKDSSDIEIVKNLATCYHNQKDYNTALTYYDKILAVQPDNFEVKSNKAIALHALKRYEEAIVTYQGLLAEKNDKTLKDNLNSALVSRGHELIEAEDYEKAVTNFKTAIKGGYTDGYVYYGLAKAYRATGDNTKASENYEKAISIDPDKTLYSAEYSDFISSLYTPKVNVQTSQGQVLPTISISMEPEEDTQKQEVKTVAPIKTTPVIMKQNEDFILEGDKNYKNNNYDAAVKNYQDALQLVPNDAVTLLKIGNSYKLKEDNTKAITFFQKSIIVNPDYTDGWFNLGIAYANENNLIESQKSFERVISLDSDYNFGYAYYALGMAFEHQGKNPEAIKNYKLFIRHNNDKDMINTVQAKIKELQ